MSGRRELSYGEAEKVAGLERGPAIQILIWEGIPRRQNSSWKGCEAGLGLACWRNIKEASVAGPE